MALGSCGNDQTRKFQHHCWQQFNLRYESDTTTLQDFVTNCFLQHISEFNASLSHFENSFVVVTCSLTIVHYFDVGLCYVSCSVIVTRTCFKFPIVFADRVCKPMHRKSNRNFSVDDNSFLCAPASQAISGR